VDKRKNALRLNGFASGLASHRFMRATATIRSQGAMRRAPFAGLQISDGATLP